MNIAKWASRYKNPRTSGFTIVELLIVIVVIGILAAITVVAFNGVQSRARDTARKTDLVQIANAVRMYALDNNGSYAEAGCGNGTGTGWLTTDYDGVGPYVPINTCLTQGGYLSKVLTDPSGLGSCGGLTCRAYMKASCAAGTFLFANLETLPQTTTDTDAACQSTWDTSYGMNYVLKVNN